MHTNGPFQAPSDVSGARMQSVMHEMLQNEKTHLYILQGVLEGAVRLFALPKLYQVPADRQPRRIKDMQEAAVLAFHAEALQPVAAHRLHITHRSFSTWSEFRQWEALQPMRMMKSLICHPSRTAHGKA